MPRCTSRRISVHPLLQSKGKYQFKLSLYVVDAINEDCSMWSVSLRKIVFYVIATLMVGRFVCDRYHEERSFATWSLLWRTIVFYVVPTMKKGQLLQFDHKWNKNSLYEKETIEKIAIVVGYTFATKFKTLPFIKLVIRWQRNIVTIAGLNDSNNNCNRRLYSLCREWSIFEEYFLLLIGCCHSTWSHK